MKKLILIFTCFSLSLGVYAQAVSEGLVAYYPFNNNGLDYMGDNDGYPFGVISCPDRYGNLNSAYYFNGENSYIIGDCSNFPTGERTMSFWFAYGTPNSFLNMGYGGGICGTSFLLYSNSGACNYLNANTIQYSSHCCQNYFAGAVVTDTDWHFITITTSPEGTKLYYDGNLMTSYTGLFIDDTFVTGRKFIWGAQIAPNGLTPYFYQGFIGKIDNVAIYNRALAEWEVEYLYQWADDPVSLPTIPTLPDAEKLNSYKWSILGGTYTPSNFTMYILNRKLYLNLK